MPGIKVGFERFCERHRPCTDEELLGENAWALRYEPSDDVGGEGMNVDGCRYDMRIAVIAGVEKGGTQAGERAQIGRGVVLDRFQVAPASATDHDMVDQ